MLVKSVFFPEPGGRDVQELAVLGDGAPGEIGDAGLGQFLADLVIA